MMPSLSRDPLLVSEIAGAQLLYCYHGVAKKSLVLLLVVREALSNLEKNCLDSLVMTFSHCQPICCYGDQYSSAIIQYVAYRKLLCCYTVNT